MSKQIFKASSHEQAGYGWGFVLSEQSKSYIEGRLLTFLESLGLRETQEKAAKDLIRQEITSWFYPDALQISDGLNTAIQNIAQRLRKYQEEKEGMLLPHHSEGFEFEIIATEKE